MAKSTLDFSHPYFQKSIAAHKNDPSFMLGLEEAKRKIESEYTSCGRVVQPMGKKFPDCHGKIWKYDWAPIGSSSGTRKPWRMVAIVPEPTKQPYEIIAAAVYPKNAVEQLPLKNLAVILAAVTTPEQGTIWASEEQKFSDVGNGDGQTRSLCNTCGETVAVSADVRELETGKKNHVCPGPITA